MPSFSQSRKTPIRITALQMVQRIKFRSRLYEYTENRFFSYRVQIEFYINKLPLFRFLEYSSNFIFVVFSQLVVKHRQSTKFSPKLAHLKQFPHQKQVNLVFE